jgi:hypothetical protein
LAQSSYHSLGAKQQSLTWRKTAIILLVQNSHHSLAHLVLHQEYLLIKLKSSLRKSYGRHRDLVDRYGIYVSQMTMDMFHLS